MRPEDPDVPMADATEGNPPSPTSGTAYAKPQPRPPKSPAHSAQIRVQNRRREWLDRHPEYLDSMEHELADPILYDALIRRFQTPAERETEGRAKGYSRVLEVDLLRGEARLTQLGRGADGGDGANEAAPVIDENGAVSVAVPAPATQDQDAFIREYAAGAGTGKGTEAKVGPVPGPESREQGRDRWNDFLRRRFVLGRDEDFDYRPVDENDDYDALERREEEDRWFNDEDPAWAGEEGGGDGGGGRLGAHDRKLEGETGIQDF